jgi:hypothetical protein
MSIDRVSCERAGGVLEKWILSPLNWTRFLWLCSVYSVKLSMLEIYCEMLNDLLDSSKLNLDVQVGGWNWVQTAVNLFACCRVSA